MKLSRLLLLSCLSLGTLSSPLFAQQPPPAADALSIQLNDGKVIYPRMLRRDKETILATIEIPGEAGQPARVGDFGFPVKDIFKLVFPKPPIIDAAPTLIAEGKAEEALGQLETALKYYTGIRDINGSWWVDLVPLQIQSLLALKRDKDAIEAADSFGRLASTDEVKKMSKAFIAIAYTRKGQHDVAVPMYRDAAQAIDRIDILALMSVNLGDSLLALGDALKEKGEIEKANVRYEEALLSYLRIPALYPGQRHCLPQATLGSIKAYFGIEDFDRALVAIKELREQFPSTPEAAGLNDLEEKVRKQKALLADPKNETKS